MFLHKGIPSVETKARLPLSISHKCSASPGWEDNAPPGACQVDRAAQLQCLQDMFFFCLSPLDIPPCLFHAYHQVCSWRYCLLLNPNLSQGWHYSLPFSPCFIYSSLHPFIALLRGARIKQYFFHVSRIKTRRGRHTYASCLISSTTATPPPFIRYLLLALCF